MPEPLAEDSPRPRKIVLLGATGSIGSSTLRVIEAHPDRLQLVGVSAHTQADALRNIAHRFQVPHVCLSGNGADPDWKRSFPSSSTFHEGPEGLADLATLEDVDLVLVATVGTGAIHPTLAAIEAGRDIALANKELLVMAGEILTAAASRSGSLLLPTDSEHNAIFQCLQGHPAQHLEKIVLTASGGPFRDLPVEAMAKITPEQALCHPNWDMGPKITVDSASMANKGLEVIEAKWLFDLVPEQIEVVIHPQSIIHSMVQFTDGSMLAQLSPPMMTFAIQHCLLYPDRQPNVDPPLDLSQRWNLELRPPDHQRFPCLQLAMGALRTGGTAPAVYNAANEVAVAAFLKHQLPFTRISGIIEHCLESMTSVPSADLKAILAVDQEARSLAQKRILRAL